MSSTGWYSTQPRSTGRNYRIKTDAHTDYDIIGRYNPFDTAIVVQLFRNDSNVGRNVDSSNYDAEIGAILCRPQNKNTGGNVKAYPLNSNINQYPAEGEYVKIGTFGGDSNVIFYELISTRGDVAYNGNVNRLSFEIRRNLPPDAEIDNTQPPGTTFKVRSQYKLRPLTSDLIFQSRYGSNIRMTDLNPTDSTFTSPTLVISNNIAPDITGNIEENISNPGSFIILASDSNYSGFVPSVYNKFISINNPAFPSINDRQSPNAYLSHTTYREHPYVNRENGGFVQEQFTTSSYNYPSRFDGDRIIISSDGVIQESTAGDFYTLSNNNLIIYSGGATSIDALAGMDINTNKSSFRIKANNTYINSPNIYIGAEEDRSQPAVLGENMLNLLEYVLGALLQYADLSEIYFDSVYDAPGQAENAGNLKDVLQSVIKSGKIPEDIRRDLLSDKVFIGSNRIDPQL